MKRVIILDELLKILEPEVENQIDKLEGKSDDYKSGYTDALDFLMMKLNYMRYC